MSEIALINKNHLKTSRDYLARMINDKVHCMEKALEFGKDYWDGDRKYGYGGYYYDGRWKEIARELITRYELTEKSKILDFGCGKAHLLFEIQKEIKCEIVGIDISDYALKNAPEEIQSSLQVGGIKALSSFTENSFDLVISLMTLHNFNLKELAEVIPSIEKISKQSFIAMESYRSPQELFNLQCWALTCKSFLDPDEWKWLFEQFSFHGDYELLFF